MLLCSYSALSAKGLKQHCSTTAGAPSAAAPTASGWSRVHVKGTAGRKLIVQINTIRNWQRTLFVFPFRWLAI